MSEVRLAPLKELGFNFGPAGERARPMPFGTSPDDWRPLKRAEIAVLEQGGSFADDWSNIKVKEGFDPTRVRDCRFYGPVHLGALSRSVLEYHDLMLPVGLYSSTVVACDIGDDVALHNVNYIAHYIVGERCMLFNVNEMITTDHAKFGNGVVMDGENEGVRIWLEIANENGGRKVLPFDGMLPSDAWIWSKFRDDTILMNRFIEMTEKVHSSERGHYGSIGSESIIKDCRILKDVRIGESAYIKGCNKLKNLTVNSDSERPSQLGEGSELVNGIIGYGCHIFYGVKAVRFILGDHSALKYGARLINSILGPNSTISCCEVLNSLLFGSHEQHHNSSFLCAAVYKGQSNMASAATVGSNHNSRASDGEVVAERGFWPGLSVSLKHNSRFAAFTLIAKGAYPAELDIPLPFCLVSNDETSGELVLMPAYWFRYNMYALARNSAKTASRDKRIVKHQNLEFDWLAPDTIGQMIKARTLLEAWAGESENIAAGRYPSGRGLLETDDDAILHDGASYRVEAGRRPVRILHAGRAWKDYGRIIRYALVKTLTESAENPREAAAAFKEALTTAEEGTSRIENPPSPSSWTNIGGQLITVEDLEKLKEKIRNGSIADWNAVHQAYRDIGAAYPVQKTDYARTVLAYCLNTGCLPENEASADNRGNGSERSVGAWLREASDTASFLLNGIWESRRKDYVNPFRNTVYENEEERDAVLGKFEENSFIEEATEEYTDFAKRIGYPIMKPL